MNKINIYLFNLTNKYLFINFIIISLFILFINFLELSRVVEENEKNLLNFLYLSLLKYPSILNEIIPFVTIISLSFMIRNLISNNEFISMRNLGYSIIDIFLPIGIAVFIMGLFFLIIINPLSVFMESRYDIEINNNDNSLYSIKVSNNEMWIKNQINQTNSRFINIKKINLKNMKAENIKILLLNESSTKFLLSEKGEFIGNIFYLNNVKYYDFNNDEYKELTDYKLSINFNKKNIVDSIAKYKLVPFYKYFNHSKTLAKFNLYSPEIGLYYLSEILKPVFISMLAFVIISFTGKYKRNENFFKVLFIAILIGFMLYLFKELITKLTLSLSINFLISYIIIFLMPFLIGLYQVIKLEND